MSKFIADFCHILEKENIKYLHWKSNTNIEKALVADDDLDILVSPNQKEEVYKVFRKHNIIRAYSEKDSWQNEIFHYFAMDTESKILVHIHLHFLLEVGYDLDKSVNLPIIDKYIEHREKYKCIYIAKPETEYILLIIRLILKNGLIPFSLMLPTTQLKLYKDHKIKGVIKGNAYREFIDLNNKVNKDDLENILSNVFPFLRKEFFYQCEELLQKNNSLKDFFKFNKELKKELKPYCYRTEIETFFLSFYRVNISRLGVLFKNKIKAKKTLSSGGRIFAFVGGDGAGKTTNITKLRKILNRHFYTKIIHIGRPDTHPIGFTIRVIAKICKLFKQKDLWKALGHLSIAYERLEIFKKAIKLKEKGAIVLLDRIPLEGVTAMDCPRIHTIKNNKYTWLSAMEQNLYNKINLDNVNELIALKLDPKIALERRPEDDPDELLIRSGQIWEKDFTKIINAHALNTNNSFDYVESNILNIVWNSIIQQPNISEIIGAAGSGKSSTINELLNKKEDIIFDIEINKKAISFFLIKKIPLLFSIYVKSKNIKCVKEFIAFNIYLNYLRKNKQNKQTLCFDQGPIFIISKLIIELPSLEKELLDELKSVLPYYDKFIMLETNFNTLSKRIKNREQEHRIKKQSAEEQKVFLERYIYIFNKIKLISLDYGIQIIEINTSDNSIKEVGEKVFQGLTNR